MSKGGGGKGAVASATATAALSVLQRAVLGALCGVGAVWALTALWPPSKSYVFTIGHHFSAFSTHYPVALLGLTLGLLSSLVWSAVKK